MFSYKNVENFLIYNLVISEIEKEYWDIMGEYCYIFVFIF